MLKVTFDDPVKQSDFDTLYAQAKNADEDDDIEILTVLQRKIDRLLNPDGTLYICWHGADFEIKETQ